MDAVTKANIKGALKFLASKQQVNGSWAAQDGGEGHPVAMTGYTLLAFMAAGNLPDQGEYQKNVAAGMQFLLDSVQPDGILLGVKNGQYMYNHGIATIALAELYGEARSPVIQGKVQRLVDVILKAQAPNGGWINPGSGYFITVNPNQSQYVFVTNSSGYYRLQYLP